MATDVKVPALGESITEGTLAQWLKKPGEAVAADEPIASLETDKVSVEVPSPVAGTMAEQLFQEGDTVEVGAVIARIGEAGAAAAAAPAETKEAVDAATNPAGAGETPLPREDAHAPTAEHADLTLSPAVRRAVLEHHVDPSTIKGTGKDGRLTKDDVLAAAKLKDGGPVHEPEVPSSPAKAGVQAPQAETTIASEAKPSAPGPHDRHAALSGGQDRPVIAPDSEYDTADGRSRQGRHRTVTAPGGRLPAST